MGVQVPPPSPSPSPDADVGAQPIPPALLPAPARLTQIAALAFHPPPQRSDRGRLSPAVRPGSIHSPRPGPGCGGRGLGGVKRLGQARDWGVRRLLIGWRLGSDLSPDPASPVTVSVPHPSLPSRSYLPPFPSSAPFLPAPSPAGLERAVPGHAGGGKGAGEEAATSQSALESERAAAGAGRGGEERREGRPCCAGGGRCRAGGSRRAVPQQPQRPRGGTSPGRPRCAPGSAPQAAPPSPSPRARAPSPPGLQTPVSSQLVSNSGAAGLDGAQGSGRAARVRRRKHNPASRQTGE